MSNYSTENIGAVLPLIRQRASETRLRAEDQEDLTQEVSIDLLTSRSEDREALLKDLDDSFRKNLRRFSRHNLVTNSRCVAFPFNP